MSINRREFLQTTAAASGVAALSLLETEAEADEKKESLPQRVLGRTKQKVSLIGFGLAPLGSDNTTPEEAERIVGYALDQGINYLDVAPVYGDPSSKFGNAEMKLKAVLKNRRKEVFLVTKVNAGRQDKAGVLKQLEESLERMGVSYLDAVHIHNLGDFDMDKIFTPDGALEGLKEARKRGLLKYIGTSGHMRPARFVTAIETGDIDLTMNAFNFADRYNYAFEELVLPAAKKQGTAVVAMKVLGGAVKWQYDARTPGVLAEHHEKAIRYALGLPDIACAVIGFANEEEVKKAVEVARAFKPLTESERTALLSNGKKIAEGRKLYYGPVTG